MDWIERAYAEIERELEEGNISVKEYYKQIADLKDEIRESESDKEES